MCWLVRHALELDCLLMVLYRLCEKNVQCGYGVVAGAHTYVGTYTHRYYRMCGLSLCSVPGLPGMVLLLVHIRRYVRT